MSSVLVNLSLIIATAGRLYTFFAKIPSGRATSQLPTFAVGSRWRLTSRRNDIKVASSAQDGEQSEISSEQKLVPPDYPSILTTHVSSNTQEDMHSTTTTSTQPDGTYRAVSV